MSCTLPVFPGLERGLEGADECRLVPCCGPAATWELLAHQSLPNSWPQTSLLQCQGWERDGACFLEKPTGGQPVSREVLLTVTFPLQGCPVLPQTPGSSVACSRSRAVPRLRLHLARRIQCSFCWCRYVFSSCQHFYLFISSASQELFPAFASLSFRHEMLTLSTGVSCFMTPVPLSWFTSRPAAPQFSLLFPWPPFFSCRQYQNKIWDIFPSEIWSSHC